MHLNHLSMLGVDYNYDYAHLTNAQVKLSVFHSSQLKRFSNRKELRNLIYTGNEIRSATHAAADANVITVV